LEDPDPDGQGRNRTVDSVSTGVGGGLAGGQGGRGAGRRDPRRTCRRAGCAVPCGLRQRLIRRARNGHTADHHHGRGHCAQDGKSTSPGPRDNKIHAPQAPCPSCPSDPCHPLMFAPCCELSTRSPQYGTTTRRSELFHPHSWITDKPTERPDLPCGRAPADECSSGNSSEEQVGPRRVSTGVDHSLS
jgi:hypothetical protein